jgi:dCTP deaminase
VIEYALCLSLGVVVALVFVLVSRRSGGLLVDRDILKAVESGDIKIEPFDRKALGTNSYDVHLAPTLKVYKRTDEKGEAKALDVRQKPETEDVVIPEEGLVLMPGVLYLASTVEYTETLKHIPILNGKSSIGRLGLSIHVTAGTGDVGFCNHWTMELFVIEPLRIYPNIPIGQLLYLQASSKPFVPYGKKNNAKYTQREATPQASRMHKNFS